MTSVGQASAPARSGMDTAGASAGQPKSTIAGLGGFWQLLRDCFPQQDPAPETAPSNVAAMEQTPASPQQDTVSFLEWQAAAAELFFLPVPSASLPPPPASAGNLAGLAETALPPAFPEAGIPMPTLPELGLPGTKPADPTQPGGVSQSGQPQGNAPTGRAGLWPEAATQTPSVASANNQEAGTALLKADAIKQPPEAPLQKATGATPERPAANPQEPAGDGAGGQSKGPPVSTSLGQNGPEKLSSDRRLGDGISFALPSERMVSHVETEKLAHSGLQKAPAAAPGQETTNVSLAVTNRTADDALAGGERGPRSPAASAEAATPPEVQRTASTDKHSVPSVPGMGMILPTMEKVGDALNELAATNPARLARLATEIQEMAVELLHFKADSLSVLIRPDGQTALHLRLMVVAGRVYAEARLQSGDGAWLQASWGELQRVLADQNVVLEPLKVSAFHPQPGQWGAERQPERAPYQPDEEKTQVFKAALTPVAAQLPPKKRRLPTGWESWA